MKKQTLIGIIIGLVIFIIIASLYINYTNKSNDESNGFEELFYEKYINRKQEKKIFNKNEDNNFKVFGLNLKLNSYNVEKDKMKFNIEIKPEDLETDYDYSTIKFSYYIYDNNYNILTNKLLSEKSKLVEAYFYKENKKNISQSSLAKYREYIHDTYKIFSKMNFTFDNNLHTCNYEITMQDENLFNNIKDIHLVIYNLQYNYFDKRTVHYDSGDVEETKINNTVLEDNYYEFEINNINS